MGYWDMLEYYSPTCPAVLDSTATAPATAPAPAMVIYEYRTKPHPED